MIIEINEEKKSASCWSLLRKYITMQGPQNVKESIGSVNFLPNIFEREPEKPLQTTE